jgi:competence ComEA-like helix-hairpin-helix protein
MDGLEADPAQDPRGRRLENVALLLLAAATLAGLGVAAYVRSRPAAQVGVLHPPDGRDRFVVYVNDDDWPTIALLPRVGETLAKALVDHRSRFGRFRTPEDLTRVRGIGAKTVEYLRPYISLDPPPTRPAGRSPSARR